MSRVRLLVLTFFLCLFIPHESFSVGKHQNSEEEFHYYKEIWSDLRKSSTPGHEEEYHKMISKLQKSSDINIQMLLTLNEHQGEPFKENIEFLQSINYQITHKDFHPYIKEKYYLLLGLMFTEINEHPAAVIQIRNAIEIIKNYNYLKLDLSIAQYYMSIIMLTSLENYPSAIEYMQKATKNAKECKDSTLTIQALYLWGNYLHAWDLYDERPVDYDRVLDKHQEALQYRKQSFKDLTEKKDFEATLYGTIYPSLSGKYLMRGNREMFDTIYARTKENLKTGLITKEMADLFLLESISESLNGQNKTFAKEYFPKYLESNSSPPHNDYVRLLFKNIEAELLEDTNPKEANTIRKETLHYIINQNLLTDWYYQVKSKSLITNILRYELNHFSNADTVLHYTSLIDTLHHKVDLKLIDFNNNYFQWAIDVKVEKDNEIAGVQTKLDASRRIIIMSFSATLIFIILCLLIAKLWKKTSKQSDELNKKKHLLETFNVKLRENNHDLRDIHEQLGQVNEEINAKNVSLNLLNAKLDQTNKSLDMYARVIAHDLKAPLKTSSQLLSYFYDDTHESLSEENNDIIQAVNNQLSKTTELIQDILDFNRMKDKKLDLEVVDLNQLMNEVRDIFKYETEHNDAQIKIEPMPKALGFPPLFKQLFLNLINNSIKYKKADVPAVITITSHSDDYSRNIISITDNGIGIKEEDQPRIFGLFEKLHNNQEYEGYGIGLATCKKIVDSIHGQIWVESTFGEGTTFHISLPKLDEKDQPVEALPTQEELTMISN